MAAPDIPRVCFGAVDGSWPEAEAILTAGGVRQVRSKAAGALEPQFYALR